MWHWWLEFLASLAYGVLSSLVPLFNSEAYILATQGFGLAGTATVVAGMAIGSAAGKDLLVTLIRAGKRLPWQRAPRAESPAPRPRLDALLGWWRRWSGRLLALMERPGWAVPVTLLSAATGLPPYYAVTVVAAAGRTNRAWFFAAGLVGSAIRFAVLAAATRGLLSLR